MLVMRCWRIVKNATSLHSLFHVWRICLDTCLAKERVDWALTPSTRLAGPCTRYAHLAWNDAQWCVQWLNHGRKHVSQQPPSAQGICWRRLSYESDEPGSPYAHSSRWSSHDQRLSRGGGGEVTGPVNMSCFLEQYFKYLLFASTPVRRLAGGGRCRRSLSRWLESPDGGDIRHPTSRTLVDVLLLAKTDHKCHQVHNY